MVNQENGDFGKTIPEIKYCMIYPPQAFLSQDKNLVGESIVKASFLPMQCLKDKCISHWCDVHNTCINLCEMNH